LEEKKGERLSPISSQILLWGDGEGGRGLPYLNGNVLWRMEKGEEIMQVWGSWEGAVRGRGRGGGLSSYGKTGLDIQFPKGKGLHGEKRGKEEAVSRWKVHCEPEGREGESRRGGEEMGEDVMGGTILEWTTIETRGRGGSVG